MHCLTQCAEPLAGLILSLRLSLARTVSRFYGHLYWRTITIELIIQREIPVFRFLIILTCFSVSNIAFAQTQKASRQTEIGLREQVKVLTERMEALERKLVEQDRGNDLASLAKPVEPSASLAPVKTDVSNSVPVPKPNSNRSNSMSIKLSDTETSLELGGYVKLDAIYNSQSVGG